MNHLAPGFAWYSWETLPERFRETVMEKAVDLDVSQAFGGPLFAVSPLHLSIQLDAPVPLMERLVSTHDGVEVFEVGTEKITMFFHKVGITL